MELLLALIGLLSATDEPDDPHTCRLVPRDAADSRDKTDGAAR